MKKIVLAAALATLPFAALAAGPDLIVNGSFEDISFDAGIQQLGAGSWTVYSAIPGWTKTAGHSIEVRNAVAGLAYDGVQFVELDSYANSAMSQTIATTAGQAYDLSFWYSPRPGTGDTNDIQVFWNGVQLGATLAGVGGAAHNWTQHGFTVIGTGSDVLTFAAAGVSDSYGGSLDQVALTAAVPEPETYAMMLAGLGLMGAVARRRRQQG
ncbi:MAG TPA: FxDxF family PEP-CTERM protein [Rhodocyclaceae bacterium]|nr:FxDxF family PEP-CTERM protein [Rhodocyclaceae bacterium]